jgi:hypothetical protein
MADKDDPQQQGHGSKATPYTKHEQAQAMKKMFEELAKMRGGQLILGCCTQGCCE